VAVAGCSRQRAAVAPAGHSRQCAAWHSERCGLLGRRGYASGAACLDTGERAHCNGKAQAQATLQHQHSKVTAAEHALPT